MLQGIINSVAEDLGEGDAETGAGGAVNIKTTSPSAKERIIQSVGGGDNLNFNEEREIRMVYMYRWFSVCYLEICVYII